MPLLNYCTKSSWKECLTGIIDAGTSNDNIKIINLTQTYNNPKFYSRKFKNDPDEFEIILLNNNQLKIRRTDVSIGGWGLPLIIDVEFTNKKIEQEKIQEQKIPRVIYQTFETMNCCENTYDAINSWKVCNYEYEHYYFDNDKRINFIDKYFDKSVLNVYLSLIAGAFKADLWRCCVLYINGGVYIDADMVCLVPLREYILPNYEFFIARDDPMSKSYLLNGFIASTPKHPFLKKQIDEIVYNVENKLKPFYLDICGPGRLGKSVNKCLQLDENSEYVLGENNINNYNFVIAFHDWKTKNIKLHGETGNPLLITEYPNKKEDMNKIGDKSYYDLYMNDIIYQIIPRNIYYTTKDELDINSYMVNSFIDKNNIGN